MVKDYHDYVIKDGMFIGKFDEMYKDIVDPWKQSDIRNNILSHCRNAAILDMVRLNVNSVVEMGCGLGYYTDFIKNSLPHINIIGVDISSTAIKKARQLFPSLNFEVGSILDVEKYSKYDVFLCAGLIWYILQDMDEMFKRMKKYMGGGGGYFINTMTFYAPGIQKYGCEYFTNLKEFIDYVPFKNINYTETYLTEENCFETCSVFKIQ
jgi:2-polyprenyl-3-methyl-5-hydroxy-6-metoxy-1,4-benzoquinol methylase